MSFPSPLPSGIVVSGVRCGPNTHSLFLAWMLTCLILVTSTHLLKRRPTWDGAALFAQTHHSAGMLTATPSTIALSGEIDGDNYPGTLPDLFRFLAAGNGSDPVRLVLSQAPALLRKDFVCARDRIVFAFL